MIKRPAVFFDRDNTLIVSDGYLGNPAKVILVDGAANAVAKARQYGFKVLTFSNQSGVARGMFDEAAVQAVNRRMDELLVAGNPAAVIERHEYCPDHPEAQVEQYKKDSPRRKPKPGMLLDAAEKSGIDLARSWVVGDAPRDIEAGKDAGCRTILFKTPDLTPSPAAEASSEVAPDFTVSSLKEAVELIGREAFRRPTQKPASPPPPAAPTSPVIATEPPAPTPVEPAPAPTPAEVEPATSAADLADLPPAPVEPATPLPPGRRVEALLSQILAELKRQRQDSHAEFSVTRLLAVIAFILSLGMLFLGYLYRTDPVATPMLLAAISLQSLCISLLLLGRGR